ncbi:hypothetical protein ACK3SF_04840 [Candidatus Nanosalina sp. VS9-1]|uniref:hypothetical protein n=1 Tax=Candidatus Nanosalina sp. VS9-1 TaxID=3388566 RepID=UPI0039E0E982
MEEPSENEVQQALELFGEFTEGLDEVNEQLEVLEQWYSTGRSLGEENAQKYVNRAEGLYRMATNVLENTDYTPEASEQDILRETEQRIEQLPEYLTEDFRSKYF